MNLMSDLIVAVICLPRFQMKTEALKNFKRTRNNPESSLNKQPVSPAEEAAHAWDSTTDKDVLVKPCQ